MNYFFLICTATVACLLFANVDSSSQPRCSGSCERYNCPSVEGCKCGTYQDYCGCCSYCVKCPGEECLYIAREKCAYGTTCKPRPGATGMELINGPGWCQ